MGYVPAAGYGQYQALGAQQGMIGPMMAPQMNILGHAGVMPAHWSGSCASVHGRGAGGRNGNAERDHGKHGSRSSAGIWSTAGPTAAVEHQPGNKHQNHNYHADLKQQIFYALFSDIAQHMFRYF